MRPVDNDQSEERFKARDAAVPTAAKGNERYLPTLDGWRAIAIFLVIVGHGVYSLDARFSAQIPKEIVWQLETIGSRGVDIFFALSGFLICQRLIVEKEQTGHISLSAFYVRRAFRILPPLWFYLIALMTVALITRIKLNHFDVLGSFLFFRNYRPTTTGVANQWYTDHLWSLSVEEHFYLILPALLVLTATLKRAKTACLSVIVFVTVWRTMCIHLLPSLFPRVQPIFRTDFRLDALMFGAVAALYLPSLKKLPRRLLGRTFYLFLTAVILLTIPLWRYIALTPDRFVLVPALMAFILPAGVLMYPFPFGKLLEMPVLRWIGRLSYSIYLWQTFFLVPPAEAYRPFGILQTLPLSLMMILMVSCFSYYCVEKPFIRLGRKYSRALQGKSHGFGAFEEPASASNRVSV